MKRRIVLLIRRKGLALPLALIVLLVAGMIVAVSMYIVENMANTARMHVDDQRRLNAALAGAEFAKQRILDSVLAGGPLPSSRQTSSLIVTLADVEEDRETFSAFIARRGVSEFRFDETDVAFDDPSISFAVFVYDLRYEPGENLLFSRGFPPRMRWEPSVSGGGGGGGAGGTSLVQNPSYGSSNRGVSPVGQSSANQEIGYYLVRSTASTADGLSTTVEQSVVVRR